jgi:membrane peptidoglycan carboxypeptidase
MSGRNIFTKSVAAVGVIVVVYAVATIGEGFVRAPAVVARQVNDTLLTLRSEALSPEQLRILLTVEDPRFFDHHGIDLRTPGAGMTTITQGLVKFLYFDRFEPGLAKIRQSLLAIGFDARIDKRTQLALFLNAGYLGTHDGRPVHGFEDAARRYFRSRFAHLSRDQYLSLVAMCVGPDAFSVARRPDANRGRVARIKRLLSGQCRPQGWRDVYYPACAPAG